MAYFQIEGLQAVLNSAGWTLLHFLWQGTVIALLLRGILILLRKSSANLRYVVMCLALLQMLLMPPATFSVLSRQESFFGVNEKSLVKNSLEQTSEQQLEIAEKSSVVAGEINISNRENQKSDLASRIETVLPWLVTIWLCGVLFLSIRMILDWRLMRKLKSEQTSILPDWKPLVDALAARLGINKSVQLMESSLVKVPLVIGWLKPIILLPVGAVLNLTPQHLEGILAHELAHVRRHDYIVNVLQTFAEIMLFYHPAVLWVSRQIRIEREYACDDLAITACGGDRINFARALTKVERMRKRTPILAAAANGGELELRVRRLVDSSFHPSPAGFISSLLICLLLFAISVFCWLAAKSFALPPVLSNGNLNGSHFSEISGAPEPFSEQFPGENQALRKTALRALGKHNGTVIIMDPNTGRLYTIVNQDFALKREWSPASTFKLITGLAALSENQVKTNEKFFIANSNERLDLKNALRVSENEFFTQLGLRVGSDKLLAYARQFGFGEKTGVNIAGESGGSLPSSFQNNPALLGAYGQDTRVTPMQLAVMVSAFANQGKILEPVAGEVEEPHVRRTLGISPDSISQIVSGMRAAVESGTGRGAFTKSFQVAGKTGTAKGEANIGLFASFAPADNPRFVVVVAISEPDANGAAAAQIAGDIYRVLGGEGNSEN